MEDKPSYYAVLTADVRYDNTLRDKAKLLYAEITSLCNTTGECWASNAYFAELYGVTNTTITTLITELVEHGYLIRKSIKKNGVEHRIIMLSQCNKLDTPLKNFNAPLKNSYTPPLKNFKVEYNNNNNINNNIIDCGFKNAKKEEYKDIYNHIISTEIYLHHICEKYSLDKYNATLLINHFTTINKSRVATEFDYKKHFENWLNTSSGKEALKSVSVIRKYIDKRQY